ncbi:MAG: hypothetical protein Q4G08_08875 [Capnocytophaga sp.]|nr:hypothetical protein [Capnocytophaga sp.]
MKRFLLLSLIASSVLLTSCSGSRYDDDSISLYDYLHNYDIWYVDINATRGNGSIPFIERAFTLTFANGRLMANNNLVGIGQNNLYGINIGNYSTRDNVLYITHVRDGQYRFEVEQVGANVINLYDIDSNLVYRLVGYSSSTFNYDMLFFDNIRYFLQEYEAWENSWTSQEGTVNPFDDENYLRFVSEQGVSEFDSSKDAVGIPLDKIIWDHTGQYTISNVTGSNEVKLLTLDYGGNDLERFELRHINDDLIELYHIGSGTTYEYTGLNNIIFLKKAKDPLETRLRYKDPLPTVDYTPANRPAKSKGRQ